MLQLAAFGKNKKDRYLIFLCLRLKNFKQVRLNYTCGAHITTLNLLLLKLFKFWFCVVSEFRLMNNEWESQDVILSLKILLGGAETECSDIDECSVAGFCENDGVCSNSVGSFNCTCNYPTYTGGVGQKCDDNDECVSHPDICGAPEAHMVCVNSYGGYSCICAAGYRNDTEASACVNIDECFEISLLNNCGRSSISCSDTPGSFQCTCATGFQVSRLKSRIFFQFYLLIWISVQFKITIHSVWNFFIVVHFRENNSWKNLLSNTYFFWGEIILQLCNLSRHMSVLGSPNWFKWWITIFVY